MMIKIVTFFLIGMAVLAMFGRLRFPGIGKGGGKGRGNSSGSLPKPRRCKTCGRINVTGGPCETCDDGTDASS